MLMIREALAQGKAALKAAGIDSYSLDGELIMAAAAGLSRVEVLTKPETIMSPKAYDAFQRMLRRRLAQEPLQYILTMAEFMGLDFYVDQHVLIPRPDTECLVESALCFLKKMNGQEKYILDLCTGSGCIGISLAAFAEDAFVTAVDISADALAVAERNAVANSVKDKITFIQSDMFTALEPLKKFHLILSNPPYISATDMKGLESNVKDYEPWMALDGGSDGLDFYRVLAEKSGGYLLSGGLVLLEIGYDQKDTVTALFQAQGFTRVLAQKDLSGLDRVLGFSK